MEEIENESFQFAKKKKLDLEGEKSEYYDIKIETNLSKLELNKEAIKGVYLFGCDIEQENQVSQEINKVNIMRQARKLKCFQEEIKKRVPDYYISGLILMGKPKNEEKKKFKFYLKMFEKDGKKTGEVSKEKPDFSDNEKVYKFKFKRKEEGLSEMAEKENADTNSVEAQCVANYLNICLGKLLKKCGYTKDRTTRKILYYNKNDAYNAKFIEKSDFLFFPALKAVCETYENNRIFIKLLPKRLLKTSYTYAEYFDSLEGSSEERLEKFKNKVLNKRAIKIYDQAMIKIEDVVLDNPYNIFFKDRKNEEISVGDYYYKVLNISLPKKDKIPIAVRIIDKGGKLKDDDRLFIHIPCSQLEIIGNIFEQNINIKSLVQRPNEKYYEIDDIRYLLEEKAKNTDVKELHNYLGEKFDPVTINGQVIKPPLMIFDKNISVEVKNGSFEMINTSPYSSIKELNKINIFLIDLNENERDDIWNLLKEASKELGIAFKEKPEYYYLNSSKYKEEFEDSVKKSLKEFDDKFSAKNSNIDFIFMFMDSRKKNKFHYKVFKSVVNEFNWMIPTQVILYDENKLNKKSVLSQFTNILCQMWAKKGNELYICDFSFVPKTMVVAYSSMAVQNNQILTSISVSIGTKLYEYMFYSSLEPNKNNDSRISPSIKSLLLKALSSLGKHLKKNVENIVIYRDAVNEKQQRSIKDFELDSIKNAIIEANDKLEKKVFENTKWCLILVSKINEIKMFFKDNYKGNNQTIIENIPVGTLVDRVITNKEKYDFYLNSADSRQGTCSPTHYIVLHDDTDLTAIQIYKLTYYLTYLCYNTTKSIRVPAPLYFVTRRNKFTYENLQGKIINPKLRALNISL